MAPNIENMEALILKIELSKLIILKSIKYLIEPALRTAYQGSR